MKVFLRKRLWFFGLLIIMQLFSSFLAAYPIKIITVIINDLGSDFHMSKKFYIYVIVFLMCELLYFWLSNLVTYLYAKAQSELAAEYRDYLYNRMLKKDMSFFDSRSMSDIDGLIMFDSEIIAQGEIALINYSAKTIFSLGFTLYFMFRLSIPLTLIVLPFGIALGIYSSKSSRLFERLSKDNRRRNTKLWNVCQESIKGIREIKVNNYYHEYESLFGNVNKEVFKNNTNTWLYKFKCEFFNGVFLTIMLGVVIMMGAFYVSNDAISIGAFVALFTYCSNLATPIQSIVFMALDLSKCND